MAHGEPFGPAGDDGLRVEMEAGLLPELIAARVNDEDGLECLWLRRVRICGPTDLRARKVSPFLRLEDCEFTDEIDMEKARATDIRLLRCTLIGGMSADQLHVRWNLRFDQSTTERPISLHGARVDGALILAGARLDGKGGRSLDGDMLEVANMFGDELIASGELSLRGAKIGGQLSLEKAELSGSADSEGSGVTALNADGVEVADGIFLRRLTAVGEVRFLGAKVGGPLTLEKAKLEGRQGPDGGFEPAFSADRAAVPGGLYCKEMTATGEVRLLRAKVGAQISLQKANLEGKVAADGSADALSADGVEVFGGFFCDELTARGQLRLPRARVDGPLSLEGTSLIANPSTAPCLSLVGATVDELYFAFESAEGTVDLRNAKTRSLRDAEGKAFAGALPDRLRLDGFSYDSLREPLDAECRLEWIALSQQEHHLPGPFMELADAFRRIGRRSDARAVAMANERFACRDLSRWSLRRAGRDFLRITIGYGYRDWLAGIWLLGLILVGTAIFACDEGSFVPTVANPPPFNPALYAIDATVPILDLGQTRAWAATGLGAWAGLVLAVSGYALAAAVVAAAAGLFDRERS